MSESTQKLQKQIEYEYGKKSLRELEIPSYIKDNLSKELRAYQKEALKYYLAQRELIKDSESNIGKNKEDNFGNHLLFNMATGSGKTLIMAALMLDLYKRGYREFVFFVNSTAILEKTRANFCDDKSSKYLFKKPVNIDGENVTISAINHFNDSREGAINIYFSTIQGLYSLFQTERENSLTFADLKGRKIVFLADEAHHLNAETKKKLNEKEKERKEGWESTMKKAFASNAENIMLEFTATVPNDKEVHNKYTDKIIFEYNLKGFCNDGYSKRIFVVKYDSKDLKMRFLGACLLSVYRQLLALKHKIFLKPVVLFKSEKKDYSYKNQENFNAMLENLDSNDIKEFYKNINLSNELFVASLGFFKKEFENYETKVAELIRANFKANFQLNANDEKEADKNQIKLNTLEDKDNDIRVIFAVDRLNEGWDVLNLFDIVRLNDTSATKKSTTTQEAQLIGRGARYFPFGEEEVKYVRKYDKAENFDERSMLERLSYHSLNEVTYLDALKEELTNQGVLFDEKKEIFKLSPSKRAKKLTSNNKIFYVKNNRYPKDKVELKFHKCDEVRRDLLELEVPYFSKNIEEKEEKFDEKRNEIDTYKRNCSFGKNICFEVMFKAMNMLKISMHEIKQYSSEFKSKKEFYESFKEYKFNFDKRQKFNKENQLELAKFILQSFKNSLMKKSEMKYKVSEFMVFELENKGIRSIFASKEKMQVSKYEWLYYDKWSKDSSYELDFLEFIDKRTDEIDEKFEEWIILRNDGFSEFKIYDNREDSPTYDKGFEPDFIFFGKRRGDKSKHLSVECIMESKGEHLEKDNWKETLLLKELNEKKFNKILNPNGTVREEVEFEVLALPFYSPKDKEKFENNFRKIFENIIKKEE